MNASTAAEAALEKGEIDIADLENRIRRAAEIREADTQRAEDDLHQARKVANRK